MTIMDQDQTMTMEKQRASLDDFFKMTYSRRFHSIWTAVLGENQSGKTAFNLFQLERIHALGLGDGFGANIPDMETPFKYDFIEDFPTLKKRCQMLNPDPEHHGIKRYFFLGSEMGDWIPQDQPWLNVEIIKELQQVRKYGLSFLGDGIDRVDQRVLNPKHFHGYFEKGGKTRQAEATYHDWMFKRKVHLHGIPMTGIKYDQWYSAMFYMKEKPNLERAPLELQGEFKIVKDALDHGNSWKAISIDSKTGSRALWKVAQFAIKHLGQMQQQSPNGTETNS